MKHPATEQARSAALEIYRAGVEAVSPQRLVPRFCSYDGKWLRLGDHRIDLDRYQRVFVCGAGKASCGLAKALIDLIPSRVAGGLVVTKYEHGLDLGPVQVLEAGHPVPDECSLAAGEAMLKFAHGCRESDLVVFLLSGGASALMEALNPGTTLEFMAEETRRVMNEGAGIQELNGMRSQFSRIKVGGLGRAFSRSNVYCLVLSDVAGDPYSTIGSGPLWMGGSATALQIPHILLGNLKSALDAGRIKSVALGLKTFRPEPIYGESRVEAQQLVRRHDNLCAVMPEVAKGGFAILTGGETTVTVTGHGLGGRCQEFACAAAVEIADRPGLAILAGSTDGTDGPTDVAAGLVDGDSMANGVSQGVDALECLTANDSNRFLEAVGGAVRTGPTQSNVNDIYLLIHV